MRRTKLAAVRLRPLSKSRARERDVRRTLYWWAALGWLLGMLLASALPRSDVESGIMGAASGGIKKRAGEAASDGVEAAKGVASTVLGDVADRADQEGLSPRAIHQAAKTLAVALGKWPKCDDRRIRTFFQTGPMPRETGGAP